MSTVTVHTQFTLAELAKRTNDKDVLEIANTLATNRDMLEDAYWVEGNQVASHIGSKVTSLPSGTYRRGNQGVGVEAATTKQVTEGIGRLEAISDIDEAIIDIYPPGRREEIRRGEDKLFIEGLGQTICETMIYGNISTDPEKIDGLATRYDALSDANVLGAGGTGDDTTSLWIIEWGQNKVHMFYPAGSKVGISFEDKGKVRTNPTASTIMYAYETQFVSHHGMFIHDDRCVQRIANIETSGSTNTLDDNQIIEALNLMPMVGGGGSTMIYVNRVLKTQLDILAKDKTNVNYTADNAFGAPVTRFRGVPVRLEESINNTETAIS
jgi:hypothetical protein